MSKTNQADKQMFRYLCPENTSFRVHAFKEFTKVPKSHQKPGPLECIFWYRNNGLGTWLRVTFVLVQFSCLSKYPWGAAGRAQMWNQSNRPIAPRKCSLKQKYQNEKFSRSGSETFPPKDSLQRQRKPGTLFCDLNSYTRKLVRLINSMSSARHYSTVKPLLTDTSQ